MEWLELAVISATCLLLGLMKLIGSIGSALITAMPTKQIRMYVDRFVGRFSAKNAQYTTNPNQEIERTTKTTLTTTKHLTNIVRLRSMLVSFMITYGLVRITVE